MKAKEVIKQGTTYDFKGGRMIATDGSYWKFKTKDAAEAWFDGPGQKEILCLKLPITTISRDHTPPFKIIRRTLLNHFLSLHFLSSS